MKARKSPGVVAIAVVVLAQCALSQTLPGPAAWHSDVDGFSRALASALGPLTRTAEGQAPPGYRRSSPLAPDQWVRLVRERPPHGKTGGGDFLAEAEGSAVRWRLTVESVLRDPKREGVWVVFSHDPLRRRLPEGVVVLSFAGALTAEGRESAMRMEKGQEVLVSGILRVGERLPDTPLYLGAGANAGKLGIMLEVENAILASSGAKVPEP